MSAFLILARDTDRFASALHAALEARGHTVVVQPHPFVAPTTCTLDAAPTRFAAVINRAVVDEPMDYLETERRAATLAWLHSVDCPVINRLDAALWYRPMQALQHWQPLLAAAGLPVPEIRFGDLRAAGCLSPDTADGLVAPSPACAALLDALPIPVARTRPTAWWLHYALGQIEAQRPVPPGWPARLERLSAQTGADVFSVGVCDALCTHVQLEPMTPDTLVAPVLRALEAA